MDAPRPRLDGDDAGRLRKRRAPKGRQVDEVVLGQLQAWFEGVPPTRDRLIEALHRINDRLHRLPGPHMVALAHWMRLSQAEVYEVASFYHHFDIVRDAPDARDAASPTVTVRVCDGLSCQMAGAQALLSGLPALLGIGVRVVKAPCMGRCDGAPAAVVHQHPVAPASLAAVQTALAEGRHHDKVQGHVTLVQARIQGEYALWHDAVDGRLGVDTVLQVLGEAGLRGLGGAGFPAARKWHAVRAQPAPRLMAVNIDEGEPGTFKDRWLLERWPHRVLEGMLLAAWAVGAEAVYLYVRDEYHGARDMLAAELAALKSERWATGLPRIELRRGAGAYICGEESALIESIEGRRGMPRLRPPYVAEVGLFGRPTLVHNLETLYWIPELLRRGARWWTGQGRHGRQGLRHFSVSGRVRQPGVKCAPAGITLRELVDEFCGGMADGHTLYAYLPGGASGGILPAHLADLPLDFDTLQPHGCFIGSAAVVVLSQADRAMDAARHSMRFFADESCGQCTPCRLGTAKALGLMAQPVWDAALLAELSQVMRDASICGLGQAAPNTFDCVLRHFAHEVQA